MSRAGDSRKRERVKGAFAEAVPIFPSVRAGGCGNTVFTVTYVEGYQQICGAFTAVVAWRFAALFSFFRDAVV